MLQFSPIGYWDHCLRSSLDGKSTCLVGTGTFDVWWGSNGVAFGLPFNYFPMIALFFNSVFPVPRLFFFKFTICYKNVFFI